MKIGSVTKVEWGHNIIGQLFREPVVQIQNASCEYSCGRLQPHGNPTFWSHAGRLLGALRSGDAVVVPAAVQPVMQRHLAHLNAIGIASGAHCIGLEGDHTTGVMSLALQSPQPLQVWVQQARRNANAPVLLPLIGSARSAELAQTLGIRAVPSDPAPVNRLNNKGYLMTAATRAALRTTDFRWICAGGPPAVMQAYRELTAGATEAVVFAKPTRAVSGYGMAEIHTPAQLTDWLQLPAVQEQLAHPDFGVVLDRALPTTCKFYNVMISVGDTPAADRLINVSLQLLKRVDSDDTRPRAHCGNMSVDEDSEVYRAVTADLAVHCEMLRREGMRGLVGIDLAYDHASGAVTLMEDNARGNGNMGASFTAMSIGARCTWAALNDARVPPQTTLDDYVAHLRSANVYYNPTTGYGVFVVNPLTLNEGAAQIGLRAPDVRAAEQMMAAAQMVKQ